MRNTRTHEFNDQKDGEFEFKLSRGVCGGCGEVYPAKRQIDGGGDVVDETGKLVQVCEIYTFEETLSFTKVLLLDRIRDTCETRR